jgi:hypothetical protein
MGFQSIYSFPVSDMPKNVIAAGFSGLNEQHLILGVKALERAWANNL